MAIHRRMSEKGWFADAYERLDQPYPSTTGESLKLLLGKLGSYKNAGEYPILHPVWLRTIGKFRTVMDNLKQAVTALSN